MLDVRQVNERFAVAPQIAAADVAEVGKRGFTLLINNRPDGEAPDQADGAEIEAAARAAGLAYVAIPVRGMPTPEQAAAQAEAVASANGPALAFCRSGTRSITAWALGRAQAGDDPGDLVEAARAAGYDLSGVL